MKLINVIILSCVISLSIALCTELSSGDKTFFSCQSGTVEYVQQTPSDFDSARLLISTDLSGDYWRSPVAGEVKRLELGTGTIRYCIKQSEIGQKYFKVEFK